MKKKTLLTILIGAGVGIAISVGIIAIEVHKRKKEEEYVPVDNLEPVHPRRGRRREVILEEREFEGEGFLPPASQTEELEGYTVPAVWEHACDPRTPKKEVPLPPIPQAEDPISYLRTKESEVEEEIEEESELQPYTDSIKIISVDEFYCPESDEENSKYEKISLDYFSLDDTLSDEQGEAILTPEKIVGEALEHFGEQSKDPDIVYVRNEDVTTDFEIVRHDKSYSEYVLGYGYPEDEEKRHPKERDEE